MATNAGKSPQPKSGQSNNSRPYSVGDTEATAPRTQPSSGGLQKIFKDDPEKATGGHDC